MCFFGGDSPILCFFWKRNRLGGHRPAEGGKLRGVVERRASKIPASLLSTHKQVDHEGLVLGGREGPASPGDMALHTTPLARELGAVVLQMAVLLAVLAVEVGAPRDMMAGLLATLTLLSRALNRLVPLLLARLAKQPRTPAVRVSVFLAKGTAHVGTVLDPLPMLMAEATVELGTLLDQMILAVAVSTVGEGAGTSGEARMRGQSNAA